MAWTEVSPDGPMAPAEWHHRFDHRGEVSGRMALRLGSDDELQMVAGALSDAVVDFVGAPTLLVVEPLYAQRGNGRVGRGGPARG